MPIVAQQVHDLSIDEIEQQKIEAMAEQWVQVTRQHTHVLFAAHANSLQSQIQKTCFTMAFGAFFQQSIQAQMAGNTALESHYLPDVSIEKEVKVKDYPASDGRVHNTTSHVHKSNASHHVTYHAAKDEKRRHVDNTDAIIREHKDKVAGNVQIPRAPPKDRKLRAEFFERQQSENDARREAKLQNHVDAVFVSAKKNLPHSLCFSAYRLYQAAKTRALPQTIIDQMREFPPHVKSLMDALHDGKQHLTNTEFYLRYLNPSGDTAIADTIDQVFQDLTMERLIVTNWYASRKQMNRLAHALTGNTDYVDSTVTFTGNLNLVSQLQRDSVIYQNDTPNTIVWDTAEYAFQAAGATLLLPVSMWSAIQVVRSPGDVQYLRDSAAHYNTQYHRMWPIRKYTIQPVSGVGIIGTSPQFTERKITVPPGYQVVISLLPMTAVSALTVNWDISFLGANYRPWGPVEPQTAKIYLPSQVNPILVEAATVDDVRRHLFDRYALEPTSYTFRTKAGNRTEDVFDPFGIFVYLGLKGGMLNSPQEGTSLDNSHAETTSPAQVAAVQDNDATPETKESKLPSHMNHLFDHLKSVLDGSADNYLGSTNVDATAIMRTWATTMKPRPVICNQASVRVLDCWYEGVLGTRSATVQGQLGGPDTTVTVNTYDVTLADVVCNPPIMMAESWQTLAQSIQTNDIVGSSQYIRINTSLTNGDAMNRALLTSHGKYTAGAVGSTSSVLAKLLLMTAQYVPLIGIENTYWGDSNPSHQAQAPVLSPTNFPFADINDHAGTTIFAKIVDTNTFTAMESGMSQVILPPLGWEMSNIGKDVAVVPVDFSMLNNGPALAIWIAAHLEYPFKRWQHQFRDGSDLNIFSFNPYAAYTNAANHRIPGVVEKVLLVATSIFPPQNTDLVARVGNGAAQVNVSILNNGLPGVAIDIRPALVSSWDGQHFLSAVSMASKWWTHFYGNAEDYYAAHIAAACAHNSIGWGPVMNASDGTIADGAYRQYQNLQPGWDTTGIPTFANQQEVILAATSGTKPDVFKTLDVNGIRDQSSSGVRHLGVVDQIALVHKMWGMFNYLHAPPKVSYSPQAVLARLRFTGRVVTTIFDEITRTMGVDAPSMMCAAHLPDYTRELARDIWVKVYRVWTDMFLNKICNGMSLKYRPDNYSMTDNQLILTQAGLAIDGVNTIYSTLQRKPLYEQMYYTSVDDYDTSWVMKKTNSTFASIRTDITLAPINTNMLEVLKQPDNYANRSGRSQIRQLHSTQWIVGGAQHNKVALGAYLTNPSTSIYRRYATRLTYPGQSLALTIGLARYGVIPMTAGPGLSDVPTGDVPPSWLIADNQCALIAFSTRSPYYARFTRTNMTDYNMKIYPDNVTYATTQLADSDNVKVNNILDAFGLDF